MHTQSPECVQSPIHIWPTCKCTNVHSHTHTYTETHPKSLTHTLKQTPGTLLSPHYPAQGASSVLRMGTAPGMGVLRITLVAVAESPSCTDPHFPLSPFIHHCDPWFNLKAWSLEWEGRHWTHKYSWLWAAVFCITKNGASAGEKERPREGLLGLRKCHYLYSNGNAIWSVHKNQFIFHIPRISRLCSMDQIWAVDLSVWTMTQEWFLNLKRFKEEKPSGPRKA
jgi:hypothetical protein